MSATALDSVADGPSTSIVATKSNNTCMVRITRAERMLSGHGKVEFECFENKQHLYHQFLVNIAVLYFVAEAHALFLQKQ